MPFDIFNRRKKAILSKQDKSSKGNLDEKISKLCEKINKMENYYTTSSCSGRVVLIVEQDKKADGLFRFVSHDLISFQELKKELEKIKDKNIKFKQEPCVLHVACRNLKDAFYLLNKAKKVGWKRSGIISEGKRFIVELVSTEKLEFPIIVNGKIIVDDNFLRVVVKKSNENLKKSWGKIEKLEKII